MSMPSKMVLLLVVSTMIFVAGAMVVLRGAQDISVLDLGAVGNETASGATEYTNTLIGSFRWFLLVLAAFGVLSVLYYLAMRR